MVFVRARDTELPIVVVSFPTASSVSRGRGTMMDAAQHGPPECSQVGHAANSSVSTRGKEEGTRTMYDRVIHHVFLASQGLKHAFPIPKPPTCSMQSQTVDAPIPSITHYLRRTHASSYSRKRVPSRRYIPGHQPLNVCCSVSEGYRILASRTTLTRGLVYQVKQRSGSTSTQT